MITLKEINDKVNKTSWETPACELEQLKSDILKKMNDDRISMSTYSMLSLKYDRIHHLTFKESNNPNIIIKTVFDEKVGQIEYIKVTEAGTFVALYLYHELNGFMMLSQAIEKCYELNLFIEEVER